METRNEPEPRLTDRILVPLDGSPLAQRALPFAQSLARTETELILLEVVGDATILTASLGAAGEQPDRVEADLERAARERLERAAGGPRGAGLTVRTEVIAGDPAAEILRVAGERAADLIVLASHGRGAVGRWYHGSVADRVARTAPIPVAVVRPEGTELGPDGLRRLVVPLDGSDLAAAALPVARRLGGELGLPIHLLRVADPAVVFDATGEAAFAPDAYDAIRDQLRREAEDQLAEDAVDPAAEILRVAGERAADLIVLASHGRGGLSRWLLGSVAEKLVRSAAAPVLLVPVGARRGPPGTADGPRPERALDLLRREEYRPEELAALLDVDVNVIRDAAFTGRLRAEILGHHVLRVRRDDVLTWLEARD